MTDEVTDEWRFTWRRKYVKSIAAALHVHWSTLIYQISTLTVKPITVRPDLWKLVWIRGLWFFPDLCRNFAEHFGAMRHPPTSLGYTRLLIFWMIFSSRPRVLSGLSPRFWLVQTRLWSYFAWCKPEVLFVVYFLSFRKCTGFFSVSYLFASLE